MFLKQTKKKNGRIYLAIIKGYWDKDKRKTRNRTIKSIGYLDEYQDTYDDPIAHFEALAQTMSEEENAHLFRQLTLKMDMEMALEEDNTNNLGFIFLSKIYHELGIHTFMINRQRGLKSKLLLNNILKLLVYERILHPSSKLAAYENKAHYLENFNFPLESVYKALSIFAKHKDKLLLELHENISMLYGRDTSNVFYDVTNYYFHKDKEDELIRKGMGKDKKGKPIIQMGLLLDKAGLPITYKLFSGNTTDFETLLPILSELKENYRLNRVIVVADKGLNSGTNKAYNIIKGDGYIFSRSIRGTKASKEIKDYVLDEDGYKWLNDEYKIKSRIYPTEITVKDEHDKPVKVTIDEKHLVFYSDKYARRTKHKRIEAIAKAIKLINSPSSFAKAENYGAMKYIIGMKLDKKTGELTQARKNVIPKLDEALIKEEEKYDGYYSIVTSELNMSDSEIIEKYQGLWKIEESFKITKSQLKTRPAYVWSKSGIEGHFLTCFLSLLILRILELKIDRIHSTESIVNVLKKFTVTMLQPGLYQLNRYNQVIEDLSTAMDMNMKLKYRTLQDIKKIIASTKKV